MNLYQSALFCIAVFSLVFAMVLVGGFEQPDFGAVALTLCNAFHAVICSAFMTTSE